MKQKIVKLLAISLCFAFGMSLMACGTSDTATGNSAESENGTSAEDEGSTSAEDEDSTSTEDEESGTSTLTLEDGTEIELTALEDGSAGIYGEYVCANDGSVWAFGGSDLAVAYTDEDGELGAYVCTISFYQTETDENGEYYLCAVLENTLKDTTTCWYVMNVVDDDENTTGLVLQDPGDEDQYITLTLVSDDTDDDDSEE